MRHLPALAVTLLVLAACSRKEPPPDEVVATAPVTEEVAAIDAAAGADAIATTDAGTHPCGYVVPPVLAASGGEPESMDNYRARLEAFRLEEWEREAIGTGASATAAPPRPVPVPPGGAPGTTGVRPGGPTKPAGVPGNVDLARIQRLMKQAGMGPGDIDLVKLHSSLGDRNPDELDDATLTRLLKQSRGTTDRTKLLEEMKRRFEERREELRRK